MHEPNRSPSADTIPIPLAELRAALEQDALHHEPSETPTRPPESDLGDVRCPACFGQVFGDCAVCRGTSLVSPSVFAEWHDRSDRHR